MSAEAAGLARQAMEGHVACLTVEGIDGCARLLALLGHPARLVVEGGGVPFPNPVGLPAPRPDRPRPGNRNVGSHGGVGADDVTLTRLERPPWPTTAPTWTRSGSRA